MRTPARPRTTAGLVLASVYFVGFGRWSWVLIPLTFLLALAFTFPLFLALRELRLSRRGADATASIR